MSGPHNVPGSRFRGRLVALVATLASAAILVMPIGPAQAAVSTSGTNLNIVGGAASIASDLQAAISATTTPRLTWAKDVGGVRYVKALVIANSTDADLSELRAAVLAAGGSVYYRYLSVTALSVLLPASKVAAIAARADVQSISPNRPAARTYSAVELASGAAVARSGGNGAYPGLDGSGVGIAVLDSGIAWNHANLKDRFGQSRVIRAVDVQQVGDATATGKKDWTPGIDVSISLLPGSSSLLRLLATIRNDRATVADAYGHGSHVASIAAGSGAYRAPDSTGIAPNANLFDVKVLNDSGIGEIGDVLAGIDWVIMNAGTYNIRGGLA